MKAGFELYRRLLGTLRPHRRVVALSVLAMVLVAALEPLLPALLKPLVDDSLIARDATAQWRIPLLLIAVFVAKGIADYLASVSSQWVAHRAIADLREQVFSHQLHLPLAVHQSEAQGRMLSRILYDIPQVSTALSTAWIVVVRDSLVIVGLSAYLFWMAWELAVLLLLVAPVVALLIRTASRRLRGGNHAIQSSAADMTGLVGESLAAIREIKIFGTHGFEDQRFSRVSERLRKQTLRTVRVASANGPVVQVVTASAVALVLWIASGMSAHERLTPGEFVAFVAAMAMLFSPLRRLTNVNSVIQRGLAGAQSIYDLLDTPVEPIAATETAQPPRSRGSIRFESVCFAYPGQEDLALDHLDLAVDADQTVALVGASGSGKTTAIQLIARFFEPSTGRILIDGRPLADCPLPWLRQQIAWVGQQVVLFDDTIAANIAYGRKDLDEADILAAARKAHAMEFIEKLPQGLQTRVGPDGGQLSGGQRQRIALARAFLKNAPILLLDEATSALDNTSEQAVRDALTELRQHRSVILVAHRLSTVRDADRIVVMERGRVVEQGCHDDLAARGGAYAQLLASAAAPGSHDLADAAQAGS